MKNKFENNDNKKQLIQKSMTYLNLKIKDETNERRNYARNS